MEQKEQKEMLPVQIKPSKRFLELMAFYSRMLQSPDHYSYQEREKIWEEIEEVRRKDLDAIWLAYFKSQNSEEKGIQINDPKN
jgi:hypothetical protein